MLMKFRIIYSYLTEKLPPHHRHSASVILEEEGRLPDGRLYTETDKHGLSAILDENGTAQVFVDFSEDKPPVLIDAEARWTESVSGDFDFCPEA